MPKAEEKSYYCSKCNRTRNGIDFYASNNLEKYPQIKSGIINLNFAVIEEEIDKEFN